MRSASLLRRGVSAAALVLACGQGSAQAPYIRAPLELTAYGTTGNWDDASTALQSALNDCGNLGIPVHVPAGNYYITKTAKWPTQNNICPGIFGDGPASNFVPNNFNGPVISAVLVHGAPQSEKYIHDLAVSPSYVTSGDAHDNNHLISITGPTSGATNTDSWSFSRFERLYAIGAKDAVYLNTASVNLYPAAPYVGAQSSWNTFVSLVAMVGSQGIVPDYLVQYGDSPSTGNQFNGFLGSVNDAWIYSPGGADVTNGDGSKSFWTFGDIVINGGHLSQGRVLHVGGGTCPGYQRSIDITNVQVDAASTELIKADCGLISNLKASGTLGGALPWSGISYLARSTIDDLGASEWKAGGPIALGATGAHAFTIWTMTMAPGGTRVDVSVSGTVGGVDSGVAGATFQCAYSGSGNARCDQIGTGSATTASGTVSANFPTFSYSASSGVVKFNTAFTDSSTSTLDAFVVARGGTIKVQRTFPAGPTSPANTTADGVSY